VLELPREHMVGGAAEIEKRGVGVEGGSSTESIGRRGQAPDWGADGAENVGGSANRSGDAAPPYHDATVCRGEAPNSGVWWRISKGGLRTQGRRERAVDTLTIYERVQPYLRRLQKVKKTQ